MDSQFIIEDFKKCAKDPIHFINNHIKVVHPKRGLVKFKLYPFQVEIVKALQENRFNVLKKFRQAGCTTLAAAYSLWKATFTKHQTIPILSKGEAESTELLERIKIMYEELPIYLQVGIKERNKHTFRLMNGSIIKSRASSKEAGRSLAGSLLIIDEAAFIEHIDTIWAAAYPTISTGGAAFVLSTVNGMGNFFHHLVRDSENNDNEFNLINIKWQDHPEYRRYPGYEDLYDEMQGYNINVDDWEKITRSNMPHRKWLQEYESEFLGTGDTYVEGNILRLLYENANEDYYNSYWKRLRTWKDPLPVYDYLISVDTSLGRERDHSAFHVINLYTGEQVAEFYSNKTPMNEFAKIIFETAKKYNNAYLAIERNGIGMNLIETLFHFLEYDNIIMDEKGELGFSLTPKSRESMLAVMEEFIRIKRLKINSKRTTEELLTFIVNESGKAEADEGMHDDLVMSLAIACQAIKMLGDTTPMEIIRKEAEDKPLMPSLNTKYKVHTSFNNITEEDLSWLMK